MDNFDLKKYLAEGRLLKEELTPLQQYVYNFEKEVSGEDNAKEFLDGIKKLNTPNDVYDYYAFERNWEGDSDLEGDLENIYNQVLDKFKSKNENKMNNFDLKKYLAEGKLLKEFVGKALEDRNEPLYDKLVAGSGKSDTVEGEMLRAINRIVYRYYNDGDEYHTGYGIETAGPAHSFLVNANHPLRSLVSTLFKNGTNYEQTIKDVLDAILDHIESRQGKYTPNSEDMYDYEPEFEDEEDDDDYDDYYGYDEDDEDEY